MKVLGSKWFTEMGNPSVIGIVLVEFDEAEQLQFNAKKLSAYIGTGIPEETEKEDIEKIVTGGARFPVEAAKVLMGL